MAEIRTAVVVVAVVVKEAVVGLDLGPGLVIGGNFSSRAGGTRQEVGDRLFKRYHRAELDEFNSKRTWPCNKKCERRRLPTWNHSSCFSRVGAVNLR